MEKRQHSQSEREGVGIHATRVVLSLSSFSVRCQSFNYIDPSESRFLVPNELVLAERVRMYYIQDFRAGQITITWLGQRIQAQHMKC